VAGAKDFEHSSQYAQNGHVKLSHHPDYYLKQPPGHPFPMSKYQLIHEVVLERAVVTTEDIVAPAEAEMADLLRVHTAEYLEKMATGALTAPEQRRLGLTWSPALWRRSKLAVQGTLDAARRALSDGLSGNLAGGTHHAFADRGEGFCVLNDVATAIRALQAQGAIERALIVDLDVHQGNGTAQIFSEDASVFTFSIHGQKNYPAVKMRSTLDVGLPDGTSDEAYLDALGANLPRVLDAFRADVVFYLAGVDVAAGDRYGRFALTDEGVRARDARVLHEVLGRGVPLVVTLAGGYATSSRRTAELHAIVFEEAVLALSAK